MGVSLNFFLHEILVFHLHHGCTDMHWKTLSWPKLSASRRLAKYFWCRAYQRTRLNFAHGFQGCTYPARYFRWTLWFKKNDIGRSQKGFSSKIHFIVNSRGKPIQIVLIPEQCHDSIVETKLICKLRTKIVIADKSYDSKSIAAALRRKRIRPVIPSRSNSIDFRSCDGKIY